MVESVPLFEVVRGAERDLAACMLEIKRSHGSGDLEGSITAVFALRDCCNRWIQAVRDYAAANRDPAKVVGNG